jgi:hypothetical protein
LASLKVLIFKKNNVVIYNTQLFKVGKDNKPFNLIESKFKSSLDVSNIKITNQITDKFLLNKLFNINYNKFIDKSSIKKILAHCQLKTELSIEYNNKLQKTTRFAYNCFTSSNSTRRFFNLYLGKKMFSENDSQYINLNNFIYTGDNNILVENNNTLYTKFFENFLLENGKLEIVNNSILDFSYKLEQCNNLLNPINKDVCINSIYMSSNKESVFFDLIHISLELKGYL